MIKKSNFYKLFFTTALIATVLFLVGVPKLVRSSKIPTDRNTKITSLPYDSAQLIPLKAGLRYRYDFLEEKSLESLTNIIRDAQKVIEKGDTIKYLGTASRAGQNALQFSLKKKGQNKTTQLELSARGNLAIVKNNGGMRSIINVNFDNAQKNPEDFATSLSLDGVPAIPAKISDTTQGADRILKVKLLDISHCNDKFFLHCKKLFLAVNLPKKYSTEIYEIPVTDPGVVSIPTATPTATIVPTVTNLTPTPNPSITPIVSCTPPACSGGTLVCSLQGGCPGGCGTVCQTPTPTATIDPTLASQTETPTPGPSITPIVSCTPPACSGGTLVCPLQGGCPGGCGTICQPPTVIPTITPTRTTTPTPSKTPQISCTPPPCSGGTLVCLSGSCPNGCGTTCQLPPTPTRTPTRTTTPSRTATPPPTQQPSCTPPACNGGTLVCSLQGGCPGGCGTICQMPPTPTRTPTRTATPSPTQQPSCTPPACNGGTLVCSLQGGCPGGCGTICQMPPTQTRTPTRTATPSPTQQPSCTPPACSGGTLVCSLQGGCPGGCGTVCLKPTTIPTASPTATITATPTSTPLDRHALINVDFGKANSTMTGIAAIGMLPNDIWNHSASSLNDDVRIPNLKGADGVATGVALHLTRMVGSWCNSVSMEPITKALMGCYSYSPLPTGYPPYTVNLENLTAGTYDLYVYGCESHYRNVRFAVSGVVDSQFTNCNNINGPWQEGNQYVLFRAINVTSPTLTITGEPIGATVASINGLQLVKTGLFPTGPQPTPNTILPPPTNRINVNFGAAVGAKIGPAATGLTSNDHWNTISSPATQGSTFTNLKDINGNSTMADMGLVGFRYQSCVADGITDPMLRCYAYYNGFSTSFNRLDPGLYDIYAYSPSENQTFYLSGRTEGKSLQYNSNNSAWQEGNQYVVFRSVPVSANTPIHLSAMNSTISGIQIVKIGDLPSPPPGPDPLSTIISPANGSHFKGGDTIPLNVRYTGEPSRPYSAQYHILETGALVANIYAKAEPPVSPIISGSWTPAADFPPGTYHLRARVFSGYGLEAQTTIEISIDPP